MRAGIVLTEALDPKRGVEAARLRPENTVIATIDWPLEPGDPENTVTSEVAAILSYALTSCGTVAFRYDEPLAFAATQSLPPPRTFGSEIRHSLGLDKTVFGIVTATDRAVVEALFGYGGWSYAMQAALVLDPAGNPAEALEALAQRLDWRGHGLPLSTRLLFGPGHDGDFAVVAASSRFWLNRFKDALSAFRPAGSE